MDTKSARAVSWLGYVAELAVLSASIVYIVSGDLVSLFVWEALALAYLVVGGIIVWRLPARRTRRDVRMAVENRRWAWVLPTVASITGAYSAVIALVARGDADQGLESSLFAVAASFGVVLSWLLLQVGFANLYRYMVLEARSAEIVFPGESTPTPTDFLYFAFTIGTTFATSDATIRTSRVRRVALVHGVASFFYNALVIAIAIQVLQFVLSR